MQASCWNPSKQAQRAPSSTEEGLFYIGKQVLRTTSIPMYSRKKENGKEIHQQRLSRVRFHLHRLNLMRPCISAHLLFRQRRRAVWYAS
jgi:hypothetical protein